MYSEIILFDSVSDAMHPGDTVLNDIAKYHVLYPFSTTSTWSLQLFVVIILSIVGGKGGPKNELGLLLSSRIHRAS